MYIIKNALRNISRAKGRNILIGIIVFLIAVASCISLSIMQSAKKAEAEALDSLVVTANISLDRSTLIANAQQNGANVRQIVSQNSEISLVEMQKYAQSQYVLEFIYAGSGSLSKTDGFEPVSSNAEDTNTNQFGGMIQGGGPGRNVMVRMNFGDFRLTGYSSDSSMTAFVDGTNKIVDGQMFDPQTSAYECVISDQLASFNNVVVGDEIKLANPTNLEETYTLKIAGIYSTSVTNENSFMMLSAMDPANQIYMSFLALDDIKNKSTENAVKGEDNAGNETTSALSVQVTGSYILKSPEDFENFKSDVSSMGLSDDYTVESMDLNNYNDSITPIKNTGKFALVSLLVVLGIGGLILIVLNLFNIRERKYEVGVLTAIGMKKGKVMSQFMIELLVVTFAAIIVGAAVGAVASVPVTNTLVKSQIEASKARTDEQTGNFGRMTAPGGGGVRFEAGRGGPGSLSILSSNEVTYIEKMNVVIDVKVLTQLIVIGLLLTLLSSIGAVVFITRYEPLKILSERS